MSSVNRVKLPGLATGMDSDAMVKQMVTNEQSKIDKAKQKEQIINWQQEIYRTQKSPDTPGSPEGNTEGPGTASSEPLLPS